MNAHVAGQTACTSLTRAEAYAFSHEFDCPTLILDLEAVKRQYSSLAQGLGRAQIHYAIKANPAPEVLDALQAMGSHFDAASRAEIDMCLRAGATGAQISFGNTIKRASDIAYAHACGVTLFAADAEEELVKIAHHAPGASVYIRLVMGATEADWPLSRKFGCAPDKFFPLLTLAKDLGLNPVGLSFHVGSQTRRASMWAPVLDQIAPLWHQARAAGFPLELLNIGGGFPAYHGADIDAPEPYAADVMRLIQSRFGPVPQVMAEPGRAMVAEAGAIASEVLLASRKSVEDLHRWIYLDIGLFSGLAEAMGEAIRYEFLTRRDGEQTGPCIVAGPSCDSADVLYETVPVQLPVSLQAGDRVVLRNCGAYTTTYASVGFNGFPPLKQIVI